MTTKTKCTGKFFFTRIVKLLLDNSYENKHVRCCRHTGEGKKKSIKTEGYIKLHPVRKNGTLREINRYYICLIGPLHVPSQTQVCHLSRLLVFIRDEYLCMCVAPAWTTTT